MAQIPVATAVSGPSINDCKEAFSKGEIDQICSEEGVNGALKDLNKKLASLTDNKLELCVKEILVAICETMQKAPILDDITKKILEDIRRVIDDSIIKEKDVKTYLETAFLKSDGKAIETPESDEGEHKGEYLWREAEDTGAETNATNGPNAPSAKNLSDLDADVQLEYFKNKICKYIRSEQGQDSVRVLVRSVYKRFNKFFTNNLIRNLTYLIEPFAVETRKTIRDLVIKDAKATKPEDTLFAYFQLTGKDLFGDKITDEEVEIKLKEISEKRTSMFDGLKAMLMRKQKYNATPSETCGAKSPSLVKDLKDAIEPLSLGGNKTKMHKRLNKRHKTLKRKLRL
jgi:hypothetical protein